MKIFSYFLIALFAICIVGFGIQVIWNTVIVDVIGGKSITFLQALGLYALCQLLFTAHHFKDDE